jgi:D-xylose transport system permease protein
VGIPSFVVTLAGLLIFRGLTFEISQGQTFSPFQPGYRIFGGGQQGSLGEAASWIVGVVALVVLLGTLARRVRSGEASLPFSLVGGLFASALTLFMIYQFNAYDRPRTEIGYGIPSPLLLLVLAATTIGLFVNRAPVGRHVYAVGQNLEAARLVGVPVRRVVLKVFALMGALCAVGAVITTSRLNAGTTNLGTLLELNVIAAAVIGGASLDGGRGSILGGILGAFVIQSLDTGMVLVGVSSSLRQILIGFVLIGAVWVDRIAVRKT